MKSEYCEDIEQRWVFEGMEVVWLWELCIAKWEEFVFDAFGDFEPVERA